MDESVDPLSSDARKLYPESEARVHEPTLTAIDTSVAVSVSSSSSRSRATHRTARSTKSSARSSARAGESAPSARAIPSAFQRWSSSLTDSSAPYKIGPFVLLLIEEFCREYELHDTLRALHHELLQCQVDFPEADLWAEMFQQCRAILTAAVSSSNQSALSSALERLVEFCVNPKARKAVFSLDMVQAHSPASMCASPKRFATSSGFLSLMHIHQQLQSPVKRPSQRPSAAASPTILSSPLDQHHTTHFPTTDSPSIHDALVTTSPNRCGVAITLQKKAKKRKGRIRPEAGRSPQRTQNHSQHHSTLDPSLTGTYGEPALIQAHASELKRDLNATRTLERQLRTVRLETITTEPKRSLQKRLGFRTLTTEESELQHRDPYETELVLERYGFSKRMECALCHFLFLEYNLPHRVSFKGILDVYEAWQYVPPDRETSSKYRAPLCYDAVQVCRMCAQIVSQHTTAAPLPPRSRKVSARKLGVSLSSPSLLAPSSDDSFWSDPFALPPLLGDDVYDHEVRHPRRGRGGDGEMSELEARVVIESPAKAIVYAQMDGTTHFMSAKEWEVINPDRSAIRQVMEASISVASGTGPLF